MNTDFSLTLVLATVFSKAAMEGASDVLMAVMTDIVDKAQELAKSKISQLPIAQNQPTGSTDYHQPASRTSRTKFRGREASLKTNSAIC